MELNSKSNSMSILQRIAVAMMLMVAIPALGFAQKISGTVTDEQGEPLVGVSVVINKTNQAKIDKFIKSLGDNDYETTDSYDSDDQLTEIITADQSRYLCVTYKLIE